MSSSPGNLLVEKHAKILVVKINNPRKKNAMDGEMYAGLARILEDASKDDSVSVAVVTGVGEFYSSGNDIESSLNRSQHGEVDVEKLLKEGEDRLIKLTSAFFNFPKILIAVVNGPAIGIAATLAALCDVIYCSETAYFLTPFTKLGLAPEGCSTYTFPRCMGNSKAAEMLLLNHKLTAEEALRFNFVSEVYKPQEFETRIWPKIVEFSKLMPDTVLRCKALMKKFDKDQLQKHMLAEIDSLNEAWRSSDFYNAALEFMSRKSKL